MLPWQQDGFLWSSSSFKSHLGCLTVLYHLFAIHAYLNVYFQARSCWGYTYNTLQQRCDCVPSKLKALCPGYTSRWHLNGQKKWLLPDLKMRIGCLSVWTSPSVPHTHLPKTKINRVCSYISHKNNFLQASNNYFSPVQQRRNVSMCWCRKSSSEDFEMDDRVPPGST